MARPPVHKYGCGKAHWSTEPCPKVDRPAPSKPKPATKSIAEIDNEKLEVFTALATQPKAPPVSNEIKQRGGKRPGAGRKPLKGRAMSSTERSREWRKKRVAKA